MAISQQIRDLGEIVSRNVGGMETYALLGLLSELDSFVTDATDAATAAGERNFLGNTDRLDRFCRDNYVIQCAMLSDQKIFAIKTLRAAAQCGLKEAKDAVERMVLPSLPGFSIVSHGEYRWWDGTKVTADGAPPQPF